MKLLTRRSSLVLAGSLMSAPMIGRARASGNEINFSYQTGDINVLLMYVSQTGLFSKHGLQVNLLPFAAGPQQLPTLASGAADIAWMGEFPMVTSYANGLPLQLFLVERTDTSHQRLVANPKSGIASISDLKGKRIGVTIGSTSHFLAMLVLSAAKLKPSDVTLVNLTPENMPPAYFAERIDAAFTWEPNITTIEKAGGVTIASPATLGKYTAGVLVVRREFLDASPDTMQRFLAAWHEGLVAYLASPKDVMIYEAKRLGISVDEMAALVKRQNDQRPTFQQEISTQFMGPVGGADSSNYVAHLKEIADFLVQQKKIESTDINWGGLVNPEPVTRFLAKNPG